MSFLDLVLLSLASWRMASLILDEAGPFSMFAHVRHVVRADRPGELRGLALLFSCVWCMSVWTAGFLAPLLLLGDPGRYVLAVLSASAIAIGISERVIPRK